MIKHKPRQNNLARSTRTENGIFPFNVTTVSSGPGDKMWRPGASVAQTVNYGQ